ncbi:MAG TPA: YtxH domain-containing protein [Abditibacteriaceae bacterium]|jgi:gas vesicle protein
MAEEQGGGYWRGVITGLLFGAAAALLLAPKRGEEIRQEIAENASQLKDKAGDFGSNLTHTVSDKAQALKEQSAGVISQARHKGEELVADAGGAVQDAKEHITETVADLKDKAQDKVADVKDTASETQADAKEVAQDATAKAKEAADKVANAAEDKAEEKSAEAKSKTAKAKEHTKEKAENA